MSCDSGDLTELGPDAYRCNMCGYEGGDGYKALQQQRKLAALMALPEPKLRERIARDANDLRLLLVSISGATARPGVDFEVEDDGFTLSVEKAGMTFGLSFGLGGDDSSQVGGTLGGAFQQADAEEMARIKREREMHLFEAGTAVTRLRELIDSWGGLTPPPAGATRAADIVRGMNIGEGATNGACMKVQGRCLELVRALAA